MTDEKPVVGRGLMRQMPLFLIGGAFGWCAIVRGVIWLLRHWWTR
jgi:hypothetical protein